MTTTVVLTVVAALAVYAGVVFSLWRFQERIVFQPPMDPESPLSGSSLLRYRSRDGIDLVAQIVEPPGERRGVVVAFHGNAVIARWLVPWARELAARAQVVVVLPEYRGYDGLPGVPTYDGVALDATAALEATVRHFQANPSNVALYGHSLGSAVATELASTSPPATLILESPFSSAREVAQRWRVFGVGLAWRVISRVHYDTVNRVRGFDHPVHVAHGERDIIVPVRMGRAVHAAAKVPGSFLLIPEAGHNDVAPVAGEAYWNWIREAIHRKQ